MPLENLSIDELQGMVVHGLNKTAATKRTAEQLGRGVEAAKFRLLSNKVRPEFEAALARASAMQAQPETAVPQPAPPHAPLTPVEEHILSLPRGAGFDWDTDLEIMSMGVKGSGVQEISITLEIPPAAIRQRFDLMTGRGRVEGDATARKYAPDEVLAVLEQWQDGPRPAVA